MEILLLLLPLSVGLVFLIGVALWWSVENGQFDDLEGPAHRILSDDDRVAGRGFGDGGQPRALDADQGANASHPAQFACSRDGDVAPRDGAFR